MASTSRQPTIPKGHIDRMLYLLFFFNIFLFTFFFFFIYIFFYLHFFFFIYIFFLNKNK